MTKRLQAGLKQNGVSLTGFVLTQNMYEAVEIAAMRRYEVRDLWCEDSRISINQYNEASTELVRAPRFTEDPCPIPVSFLWTIVLLIVIQP
ncbi:hypothetical protein J6590_056910 [Homalodisca vitripennis]|nr:hypothetical protein J6590_056910 [Homalodisca vitripennis]